MRLKVCSCDNNGSAAMAVGIICKAASTYEDKNKKLAICAEIYAKYADMICKIHEMGSSGTEVILVVFCNLDLEGC